MVDKTRCTQRKAVGSSSGSSADESRKSTSRCQPQQQTQYPHDEEGYQSQELFYSTVSHQVPENQDLLDTLDEAQQEEEGVMYSRFISQRHEANTSEITTTSDNDDENGDSGFSSEDENQDILDHWEQIPQSSSYTPDSPQPTYNFPGTWTAALHDTSTALSQVRTATTSYAYALSTSGIGKATLSVGSAALQTTNAYALSLADWSLTKTGLVANELPAPVRTWVARKQECDRVKREARLRRRSLRKFQVETSAGLFVEAGSGYVIDLYDTDGKGEFLGSVPRDLGRGEEEEEEEEEEEDMVCGDVFEVGDGEEEEEREEDGDEETPEESGEESVYSEESEESGGKQNDGLVRLFQFDD